MFSAPRLSSLLFGCLVLLGGPVRASAVAPPGCLNPCIPEACPDTCLGCEATAPTACTPSCEGGAVACAELPEAGLASLASWDGGEVTSPEALDKTGRSCTAVTDLSDTVCVTFCEKVCTGCVEGFVGPNCEFSDATTCSGNGLVRADGSCVCDGGWTGDSCALPVCEPGFVGAECQYSNATTCNDLGFVDFDGTCSCIGNAAGLDCSECLPGTAGPNCRYSDLVNCNGQGAVQPDGSCICSGLFAGDYCEQCEVGTAGPSCIFSDAIQCLDRGLALFDGSCSCGPAFTGNNCDLCAPGYAGAGCIFSDETTCGAKGVAQEDGSCVCSGLFTGVDCGSCVSGFAGPDCQFSDAVVCTGRGAVQEDGSCVCSAAFAGNSCEACAEGLVGADCAFTDAVTCGGRGAAQFDGSCLCTESFSGADCSSCAIGFAGPDCLFSDLVTCNGNGAAQADGSCLCAANFQGAACDLCADRFAGVDCAFSDISTCNGLGVAQDDGSCICESRYAGDSCERCAFTDYNFPDCPACTADSDCSGNGICTASGSCICDPAFTGSTCSECAFGYARILAAPAVDGSGEGSGAGSGEGSGAGSGEVPDAGSDTGSGEGSGKEPGAGSGEGSGGAVEIVVACLRCPGAIACNGQDVCVAGTDAAGEPVALCACAPGTYDYDCSRTTADCSEHGQPVDGGGCNCDAGFGGVRCEIERASVCSINGAPQDDGSCICSAGWVGDLCDTRCGNGEIGEGEGCDDGNGLAGDGCNARCLVEPGYNCGTEVPSQCIVDLDEDGVADEADNCVTEPNTDQADGNNNGSGDACDPFEPIVEADAGSGEGSGDAFDGGTLERDTEGSGDATSTPPTDEPPVAASCSATGNSAAGWLSMVLVMGAASLLRRRRGAAVGLALVVALSGCAAEEQAAIEAGDAIPDTGSTPERELVGDVSGAPKDPPATDDAGAADADLGTLDVSGGTRRAGDLEFRDYRVCADNLDCPNGMGNCLKEVKLNRTAGGVEVVAVRDMPGFSRVSPGFGICTLGCTDHAELCESLRYGDDTTPWSCQLTYTGTSPYQLPAGGLPFEPSQEELTAGVAYAAVCRPPFARSKYLARDFCDVCTSSDSCWPGSACVETAPNSDAPPAEKQGMCLAACTVGAANSCPMGFGCRELGTTEQQLGVGRAGGFCVPVVGDCDACLDRDGDGVGTGSCTSQGTSSAVDCDDADADTYFDAIDPDHAFPGSCGPQLDANCNGKGDAADQIGRRVEGRNELVYGAEHCGGCNVTCGGSEGSGDASATKSCKKTETGTTDSYACTPDCDNKETNVDCTDAPGCETLVTDPTRLLVRDCDGDGHGDAGSSTLAFACNPLRLIDFESAGSASQFTLSSPAWFLSNTAARQGTGGLRSGVIPDRGLTTATYSARLDAVTTIRFWWKVSSENNYDFFEAYVNGTQVVRRSGESNWVEYVGSVPAGTVTVEFRYIKDGSIAAGLDAALVDDVQLVSGAILMADRNGVENCPGVPYSLWQGYYGDDCDDSLSSVYYAAPLAVPAGQTPLTFNTTPREVCDGRDNDCDGGGDQGVFGVGATCVVAANSTARGECRNGIKACSPGQALPVCVASTATDEVCDGLDNDCDGAVDDLADGELVSRAGLAPVVLGESCPNPVVSAQGVCAMGVWRCSGGGATCAVPAPATDTFGDDIDQDCDGIDGQLANAIFVRNGGATIGALLVEAAAYGFEAPADAVSFVGTTAPWTVATGAGRIGGNALRSGFIGNSATSATTLSVTLAVPGEIRFWVKTSSEEGFDKFRLIVGGLIDGSVLYSGETGWTEVVRPLPAGVSTIQFSYSKDSSAIGGSDAVWIDDVVVKRTAPVGTRENPVGNMAAALELVRGRTIRQFHVAGSSDPYPMPYGLRLNGAADTNFAIVGGYDVNFPARGGAVWIPGTGATRLVFANPCGNGQATCPGTEALAGYAHVEPAIEVIDPRQVIFRKVTIEVPTPPVGFGAVGGVSCKVTNALLGTCSGLTLDRVAIKMQGGAPGQVGVAGASYVRAAASSTVAFTASGGRGALGCRGSGSGGAGGKGNSTIAQRRGGSASNDAARGGGFGGLVSTDSATMAGKRGFTPSDTFWAASGGFRAQRTLPLSVFSNGAGSNGPAGGGGGGGAGWEVFGGGGGAGGGCGGGGGTPGGSGGSVFGLISTSVVDLPTTVMTSIQMGPGGAGGFGGDGGVGQQGGNAVEGPTPFEKPALTSDADWTASRGNAAFIAPGGPGGSGGGGGGGAGGSGGWSVGVAKPASLAIPLSLGVSVATNTGTAGMGGGGGGGGPSIGLDIPPAPAVGSAGVSGLPGGSISSCVLFTEGAAGDIACGLSSKRSLGSFCQADSECVSTNCASGAEGSSNDRCAPAGMAYIPAGSFAMGRYFAPGVAPVPAAHPSETYHQVEITRPFFLGRKEFTTTADWAGSTPSLPVAVSWEQAMAYANSRSLAERLTECYTSGAFSADGLDCDGYRLPTAAEFEYALRAGTRDEAYWGPFTDPTGRDYEILQSSTFTPQATGSRLPNPWGLFDMAGNRPEWTQDDYYTQTPPAVFDPGVFGLGSKSVSGLGLWPGGSGVPYLPASREEYGLGGGGFRLARTVRPPVEGGTCPLGFHVEATPTGAQCRSDVSVCAVANGKGRQLYGRGESCKASVCDPGYTVVGNACLALLGTACSSTAQCAEGRCATTPAGTANDRCAPAGMVFAPGGVHAYSTNFGLISRGFFIAETETTQLEWKQLANGANPSNTIARFDEAPVNQVDWYAAAAYANARSAREGLSLCYDLTSCTDSATGWFDGDYAGCASVPLVSLSCTGYRLPTTTEWLYASQAAARLPLLSDASTAWANVGLAPRAVAGKVANALGLYDMSGNVWEMMEDPKFAIPGSTTNTDVLAITDQSQPPIYIIGGSTADSINTALTTASAWSNRTGGQYNVGFRLARSVVAPVAGAFCPAGFHQEGSVCESDLRTCMFTPASGTKGRQRWLGSAWSACESVCAAGQMQHNGSCYSVPPLSTTCSTLAAAGPSATAAAFGDNSRLNAQTSVNNGTLVATDPVGGYRANRFSDRYAVILAAGQRVDVYLDGSPLDAWVQVYGGSSCGLLAENDDQSSSIRNAGLGFTASVAGTYYVVATSYREFETGSYTLYIVKR